MTRPEIVVDFDDGSPARIAGRRRPGSLRRGQYSCVEMIPSVSLVVPVFGTEAHLESCLSSLLRQTFDDFEVIVVDDCSPGDPGSIVAEVAGRDPRFRVVRHADNLGVMRARFTGTHAARAPYLGFVDSDDEVEEWFVEVLHAAATRHDADLVQCAFTIYDPAARLVNRGGVAHELGGGDILRGFLAGEMNNCLWNKLIRTSTWHAATDLLADSDASVSFGEDLLCLFRVAMHSVRYAHIVDAGYRYLPRDGGTMAADEITRLVRHLDSLDVVFRMIRSELAGRAEPAPLVQRFFEREFLAVTRELLGRTAALETSAPTGFPQSPAELGLMAAVAFTSAVETA